jgi:hypothetical protein
MRQQHQIILSLLLACASSFVPHVTLTSRHRLKTPTHTSSNLFASVLPDVNDMKAKDLRKELQSYGISTKSFFEKSEFVHAVEKARSEGKTPIENGKEASDKSSSSGSDGSSKKTRSERLAEEIEKCQSLKVKELKKELEAYGISTKSFFEKSEFVRAVAESRVDGVAKKGGASREEEHDPSFRDVAMQKMAGNSRPAFDREPIIDIKLGR